MVDGDFGGESLDGAGKRRGRAVAKRVSDGLVKTELGFSTPVQEREERLRGHFDASRLERDHPQLVRLVAWLIGLEFVPWDAIANEAGMTWQSVAAVAASRKESVKEFKVRNAQSIKLVMDAMRPGLLEKAKAGKLSVLDFKLLNDVWLPMAGEASFIVGKAVERDAEEEEMLRFLRAREVGGAGVVPAMGLEGEKCLAMGDGLAAAPRVAEGVPVRRIEGGEAGTVDNESGVL